MKEIRNWPVGVLLSGMSGLFLALFHQYVWPNIKLVLMDWKVLNSFSILALFVGFSLFLIGLAFDRRMKTAESSKIKGYKTLITLLCFLAPIIFSILMDFLTKSL